MPKSPKGEKRPADAISHAVMIGKIATGEVDDKTPDDGKDPAAKEMGAVLGWDGLSDALVASGKLVKLLPSGVASPKSLYIKLHSRASGKARLVYDWLAKSQ